MKATSSWLRNKKYGAVRIRHCKGYRDRAVWMVNMLIDDDLVFFKKYGLIQ